MASNPDEQQEEFDAEIKTDELAADYAGDDEEPPEVDFDGIELDNDADDDTDDADARVDAETASDDTGPDPVEYDQSEDVDYTEVDTRGLDGHGDTFGPDPTAVEPDVDPEKITIRKNDDGKCVTTKVTATLSSEGARALPPEDEYKGDLQDITDEKPGHGPKPDRVAALRARLIRVDVNDHGEFAPTWGAAYVADASGAAIIYLRGEQHVEEFEALDAGDEILLTGLLNRAETGYKYSTSPATEVEVLQSDEYPAGYYLDKQSELENLRSVFNDADTQPTAWNQVADILVDEFEIAVPYGEEDDDPTWWLYQDAGEHEGLWIPSGRGRLETVLGDKLPYDVNSGRHRREILKNVKVRCRVEPDAFHAGAPSEDDLKWVVGVKNGVVDLRTGELHAHGPEWRLSSKLPIEYKPDEYDGLGEGIDWFLDDVCKTDEDRRMCMAMAGHSLMRHHQIKSAFPVLGPSNSGKTKWHGIVKRLLGYENAHTMNFDAFAAGEGFETGKILGVHAALDDDATGKKITDLNFFKKVTGGEEVSINRKYEKLADYTPFATISWLSNDPSVLGEKNSGVRSRLYPIVMPYRHTEDSGDGHKDKIDATELESRIYAEEELEALLVAAVEKAGEMYRTGDVGAERTESERWQIYEWWSDGVKRFMSECVTANAGHVMPKDAVYEAYVRWCDGEGIEPMNPSTFWRTARRTGEYFETDGVWFDSNSRGVKHVQLAPAGLEYCPDALLDKMDATGAAKASLSTATAIRDIQPFRGPSFYTVEGTVRVGDPYEPGFLVEGDDAAIRVFIDPHKSDSLKDSIDDAGDYIPDLANGDTVRLEKMEKDRDDGRLCLQYVHGYSTVKVLETEDRDDEQDILPDERYNDDGERKAQRERVKTVKSIIGDVEEENENGAPFEEVRDAVVEAGIDAGKFEHELEKLRHQGDVYEPAEGRLRVI